LTTPTDEVSHDLQRAYRYFNDALFGGTLPKNIVLSYQRESQSFAFFRRRQYLHLSQLETDEIAVNPAFLPVRTLRESLASLCHQMVRLQHSRVCTKHSRPSYHNRELAHYLKLVGLLPRVGGDPSGKETGYRVGHVIVDGGPFDVACSRLLAEGFAFTWIDRYPAALPYEATQAQTSAPALGTAIRKIEGNGDVEHVDIPKPPLPEPAYAPLKDNLDYRPLSSDAGRRRKYLCPGCETVFWGGHGIEAKCVPCDRYFRDSDPLSAKAKRPRRRKVRRVVHQAAAPGRAHRSG